MPEIIAHPIPSVDPKCPTCDLQPLQVRKTPSMFPDGIIVTVFSCAGCGHTFTVQPTGFVDQGKVERPRIVPASN